MLSPGASRHVAQIWSPSSISNLTNLYYPEVLSELNRRLTERNVHLLLFTIQTESDVDRILGQVCSTGWMV